MISHLTPDEQEAWMNHVPWTPYPPMLMAAAVLGSMLVLLVLLDLILRFG